MATDLGIRAHAQGASVLQQVEKMSSQEAVKLLGQLETQLRTRSGGVKSGVLSLVNLNHPDQTLKFERKSWYQFRSRSADRMQITAQVIEALVDKAGLGTLEARRNFSNYLQQRSNRVGTETMQTLLTQLKLRPAQAAGQPADANGLVDHSKTWTAKSVRDAFRSAGSELFANKSDEFLTEVAEHLNHGNFAPLFDAATGRGVYGGHDSIRDVDTARLTPYVKQFLGDPPRPEALARFVTQIERHAQNEEVRDIDSMSDDDDGRRDGDLMVRTALELGLKAFGAHQPDVLKEYGSALYRQVELEARGDHGGVVRGMDGEDGLNGSERSVARRLEQFATRVREHLDAKRFSSEDARAQAIEKFARPAVPMREAGLEIPPAPPGQSLRVVPDGANLDRTVLTDGKFIEMKSGSLNQAYLRTGLRDSSFYQVDMRGLETSEGFEADRVKFTQCDLSGAQLRFKVSYPTGLLSEVSFKGSDLTDAMISIDYSELSHISQDAPAGAHGAIFNHLGKEPPSSPLTMIESIPNRFQSLKTRLMREAIEHLSANRLLDQMTAPLADLMRANPSYLRDRQIREAMGPALLAEMSFPTPSRRELAHQMIADFAGMDRIQQRDFVIKHPYTANLMLVEEDFTPPADAKDLAGVEQRRQLREQAGQLESRLHEDDRVSPLTEALSQVSLFDAADYQVAEAARAPGSKKDCFLFFPVDHNRALAVTYEQAATLLNRPDAQTFSNLTPLVIKDGAWAVDVASSPQREPCIRSIPAFSSRFDSVSPSLSSQALKTAFGEAAEFDKIIVPALKGVRPGMDTNVISMALQPQLGHHYQNLDQLQEQVGNTIRHSWERPQLNPAYLDSVRDQARAAGVNVDNPRDWATYLLYLSISVARLGSNASLGSHTDSVYALRFHGYKLMEAARQADPTLLPRDSWEGWAADFVDVNRCAEILTSDMREKSRKLNSAIFEQVVPAHFHN